MKVKFGMMMVDGRGKLGGQVASKNRAGAYVRTKVTPSNPQTASQSVVRSILAVLSKNWSGKLTEAQRAAWVEASASGEWNKSDVFGDSRKPSGFNLFVGMNSLQQVTRSQPLTVPPAKAEFLVARNLTFAAIATDPGTLQGLLDIEAGTPQANTKLQVQATAPVSAGKSYVKNLFRDIIVIQSVPSGQNTLDLGTPYEEKFGLLAGNEGKQIFIRVRQVVEGQATPWITTSAIIEAPTP